ncbi:MAG: DUF4435 domain-containing protein [Clostridium sp.]|nr:DUF4435 domain-containing protein [Clostridium sp.]
MAKRLTENISSYYIGAANRMKPRKARHRIVAYVESYDDIFFWRTFFDEFEDERFYFEVMLPSRTNLGKGKKTAMSNRLGHQLGGNMVACVDADYDYLLQDTTSTSRLLNHSPYVLHTYAYAIENYQCYAPGLHGVCVMATLNDHRLVDMEGFLSEFSLIVWPLFVWSIWVYRHERYREFTLTDFGQVVSLDEVNIFHPGDTLTALRRRVNRKVAWLQHRFPQAKADYDALKKEMLALGLTPQTTYLYIQGHTLFDNVVLPLVTPVCTHLRKEREKDIRRLAGHETQRQNELAGYQHSQNPVDCMLRKNTNFKSAPPYQQMRADLLRLLERVRQSEPPAAEGETKPADDAPERSGIS